MAKIHKDVRDLTAEINNLGITSTDIVGMICSGNCLEVTTVLASESADAWNKYTDILSGDSENPIHIYKDKKAFIIPGSAISGEKMKLELKEHGIKVTSKVEDADLFITNHNSEERVSTYQDLSLRKLAFYISNGYAITEWETGERKCDLLNKWMGDNNIEHMLWDNNRSDALNTHLGSCESDSLPYDCYVYTGLAIQILSKIKDGADTIYEDRVLEESPNQQILTDSLLQTLLQMDEAGGDDRNLLEKILPTIRVDVNHHLLWKLHQRIDEWNFNRRNKDLQYWFNKANHSYYNRLSPEDFIKDHDEKGVLTSKGFKYMEPLVRKDISIHNRELYVFTVRIKPEYEQKYLKNEIS